MEKETWKIGNHNSCVVSDTKQRNTNFPVPPNREESGGEEMEFYGGHLVCESIGSIEKAKLIAAAPDLLDACQTLLQQAEVCRYQTEDGLHELMNNRAIVEIRQAIKKAIE